MKQDVLIIGGGFSGLSAAYTLGRRGVAAYIVEKNEIAGGMATCHRVKNYWIEKFYHHFFIHDKAIISLAKELKKDEKLIWGRTEMGFFIEGRLFSFTTPLDFLRFTPLKLFEKLNFVFLTILLKKVPFNSIDGLSAKEFICKKIGSSAYTKVLKPILESKFGFVSDNISASFISGRFNARMESRGRFSLGERFGYYAGGMHTLVLDLIEKIQEMGCSIKLNTEVKRIMVLGNGEFDVRMSDGQEIRCKKIISTTAIPVLKNILEMNGFNSFYYRSSVCLCMGIKESLSRFYWIVVADQKIPFSVIVEHTNFVHSSFYGKDHIVYLSGYFDERQEICNISDKKVLSFFIEGLKKIFPNFTEDWILWWKIAREPYATSIYFKDFSKLIKNLKHCLPSGFEIAGNILTYPRSRNINNAIESGRISAYNIMS